jgi:hypothetical protein
MSKINGDKARDHKRRARQAKMRVEIRKIREGQHVAGQSKPAKKRKSAVTAP